MKLIRAKLQNSDSGSHTILLVLKSILSSSGAGVSRPTEGILRVSSPHSVFRVRTVKFVNCDNPYNVNRGNSLNLHFSILSSRSWLRCWNERFDKELSKSKSSHKTVRLTVCCG